MIGIINNMGFTMVQAGSSAIAEAFGKKSLMGYFLFLMKGSGVISRYVNGACCVNISHIRRMLMVTVFSIFSFLLIAIAAENTQDILFFYVALFSSIFMGIAQSFGEACVLGFLKAFPLNMISDFASGLGFSGPFSTV